MTPFYDEEVVRKESSSSFVQLSTGKNIFPTDNDVENFQKIVFDDKDFEDVRNNFTINHPEFGINVRSKLKNNFTLEEKKVLIEHIKLETMPRFTKDAEKIKNYRNNKVVCPVSMRRAYILGENGFSLKDNSFACYFRNSDVKDENIESAKQTADFFESANLKHLATETRKFVEYASFKDDGMSWLGFKRITPYIASVILAKIHKYEWNNIYNISRSVKLLSDFVDFDFFKDNFKKQYDKKPNLYGNVSYYPKIYPLEKIESVPRGFADIVMYCENMSELNSHKAFDCYWVAVPGISLNHPAFSDSNGSCHVKIEEEILISDNEFDLSCKIDQYLVKENLVRPCLLGEKDGKCYFLGI